MFDKQINSFFAFGTRRSNFVSDAFVVFEEKNFSKGHFLQLKNRVFHSFYSLDRTSSLTLKIKVVLKTRFRLFVFIISLEISPFKKTNFRR